MSETIGERVERHAIAEYEVMSVTGALKWIMSRKSVFVAGYMKGYMRAQDDILQKMREGKA